MKRLPLLVAALCLVVPAAFAEDMTMAQHHQMMMAMNGGMPTETGQSAFAAIAEIVALLQADPNTDWSKVNIAALQAHLADMDTVTLHTAANTEPIPGGARITVTGSGDTIAAIQRIMLAHAPFLAQETGLTVQAEKLDQGARWIVTGPKVGDDIKIRALGFYGLLTLGMHHQMHHLAIARGEMMH